MAKLMMDAIEKVLFRSLKINDANHAEQKIYRLNDKGKIALLDKLVEATINYDDSDPGSNIGSPFVPQGPSNDRGEKFQRVKEVDAAERLQALLRSMS